MNSRRLPNKRDIGGYALLVLPKTLPEARRQQPVFDAHSDLGASNEHYQREHEEWPRTNHESYAEGQTKHRAIDRMADEAIRADGDQLMVYAETGIKTPLLSERPGSGP